MEFFVFNKDMNMIGIVEEFTDCSWTRNLNGSGRMEMRAIITNNNLNLLKKGFIICKKVDLKDAMFITSRTIKEDENGLETLEIAGMSATEYILSSRIVWGRLICKGTFDKIASEIVTTQAITSTKPERNIKGLAISTEMPAFTAVHEVNIYYKNVYDELKKIAESINAGIKIDLDIVNKEYTFSVYPSTDKTSDVIFDKAFDNIQTQSYIESEAKLKNVALVAGQGEDQNRTTFEVHTGEVGLARKEIFVDARDIGKDENGVELTPAEQASQLMLRGLTKLSSFKETHDFVADVEINNYKYRSDFDLGDKVKVQNSRWGLELEQIITRVEEKYDAYGVTISTGFGYKNLNIIEALAEKIGG